MVDFYRKQVYNFSDVVSILFYDMLFTFTNTGIQPVPNQ